jgi:rod shape-determining protein MreC
MENFLNRYRSITVLLLVIFAQLVLLAMQVKNGQDVPVIRLWTVTAVTPMARIIEGARSGSIGLVRNYILLHDAGDENRRLKSDLDRLKVENIFLRNELNMADRGKALEVFQKSTPSRTLAASVIGTGAGSVSKVFFVDRGSSAGVERGMGVITPEGIVGKVTAAYPTASEILLITDPEFAAGVVSQKHQTHGTLKGQGTPVCKLDYVPPEDKVEPGEWLYTSGDDRVFPRGFPVGVIKSVRAGQPFQEIDVQPAGMQHGVEDVLILLEGAHQAIPEVPPANQPVYIAAPAPAAIAGSTATAVPAPANSGTEADKLRTQYKAVGDAQGHKFGEGLPGSKPPDFNMPLPAAGGPVAAPGQPQAPGAPRPNAPAAGAQASQTGQSSAPKPAPNSSPALQTSQPRTANPPAAANSAPAPRATPKQTPGVRTSPLPRSATPGAPAAGPNRPAAQPVEPER